MVNEDDTTQRSAREAAAERAFQLPVPARTRARRRVKGAATLVVLIILYGSWRPSPLLLLVLFQVGRWALIACSVGTGLYLLVRFIKWAWNND